MHWMAFFTTQCKVAIINLTSTSNVLWIARWCSNFAAVSGPWKMFHWVGRLCILGSPYPFSSLKHYLGQPWIVVLYSASSACILSIPKHCLRTGEEEEGASTFLQCIKNSAAKGFDILLNGLVLCLKTCPSSTSFSLFVLKFWAAELTLGLFFSPVFEGSRQRGKPLIFLPSEILSSPCRHEGGGDSGIEPSWDLR